jgi:hypothetical protein
MSSKNSKWLVPVAVAGSVVALVILISLMVVGVVTIKDAIATVLDLLKSALGSAAGLGAAYAVYLWHERRYGGWVLVIITRDGREVRERLTVEWTKSLFSGGFEIPTIGPWQVLTGAASRIGGLVAGSADEARASGGLVVDPSVREIRLDFRKLPEPPKGGR